MWMMRVTVVAGGVTEWLAPCLFSPVPYSTSWMIRYLVVSAKRLQRPSLEVNPVPEINLSTVAGTAGLTPAGGLRLIHPLILWGCLMRSGFSTPTTGDPAPKPRTAGVVAGRGDILGLIVAHPRPPPLLLHVSDPSLQNPCGVFGSD